jgi:transcriptional regulator with XRE-family HTH domain
MDIRILIGRNLRTRRQVAGLSQEDLADQAAIDRTYVSGLERGLRNPSALVLQRLADALDIEVVQLLERPARRQGR